MYFCNQKYQKFFFGLFVLDSIYDLFLEIRKTLPLSGIKQFRISTKISSIESKNSQKERSKN
jgi:hypothetical protein